MGYKCQESIKYARRHKLLGIEALCCSMSLAPGEMFIPSRKSALATGVDFDDPDSCHRIQQEWTITCENLLLFLALTLKVSHGRKKSVAEAIWMSFFAACLPPGVADMSYFRECRIHDGDGCKFAGLDGMCAHIAELRDCLSLLSDGSLGPPQTRLACVLAKIIEGDIACPRVGRWLMDGFRLLQAPIRDTLPNAGDHNALMASPCFGPRKRRRMDEHMKTAIVCEVKQKGMAPNAPSWARATGNANLKSMGRVRDEHLLAYSLSGSALFKTTTVIKLALDGARLGEPKEEYFVAVLENCETNEAVWAPPAVPLVASISAPSPGKLRECAPCRHLPNIQQTTCRVSSAVFSPNNTSNQVKTARQTGVK